MIQSITVYLRCRAFRCLTWFECHQLTDIHLDDLCLWVWNKYNTKNSFDTYYCEIGDKISQATRF